MGEGRGRVRMSLNCFSPKGLALGMQLSEIYPCDIPSMLSEPIVVFRACPWGDYIGQGLYGHCKMCQKQAEQDFCDQNLKKNWFHQQTFKNWFMVLDPNSQHPTHPNTHLMCCTSGLSESKKQPENITKQHIQLFQKLLAKIFCSIVRVCGQPMLDTPAQTRKQ